MKQAPENQVSFKIYTEDVAYTETLHVLDEFFSGYTVYRECTGRWNGTNEESLVIEFHGTERQCPVVRAAAHAIKLATNQNTVRITINPITILDV